jgi:L-asparaginase
MRIRFITVGGTIDKVYFDALSEYQVGAPGIERLLQDLPLAFDYVVESVLRKDSLEMTDDDRQLVVDAVQRSPESKIIITHGTDTMACTAKLLTDIPGKVVVLTGAMQPAGFTNSDALFNVGTAVGGVNTLPPGAYIAMSGQILAPHEAQKDREKRIFRKVTEP